jgi:uncharacterized protein YbaP (TraB family)
MRTLLACLALCWASLLAPVAHAAEPGFLFEARRGDRVVWLYGTVHVGQPDGMTLGASVRKLMRDADALAVEVDVSQADAVQRSVMSHAMLPAGTSLESQMTAPQWKKLVQVMGKLGFPAQNVQPLKPWMVGALLVTLEAQSLGYASDQGADVLLIQAAQEAHKPVLEIEGADAQFAILDAGSVAEQTRDLMEALDAVETGESAGDMRRVVTAWQQGDAAAMQTARIEMRDDKRESVRKAFQELIAQRDVSMAKTIEHMSARHRRLLVAVGSLHLVGEGCVVDQLRSQGFVIKPF